MAISLPFNFCRLNTTIVGIAGAFRTRQRMTILIVGCLFSFPTHAAVNIPITVNLSESVNVTGTPQIAVDVGGTTRQATYTSGTGTNALTFTLAPQAGDVDLDGVTVSSPIDLNGGTIKDTKGNDAVLTFTPPNTANVKVNYPSLGMDFVADADGRYTLNGTVYNDLTSFLSAAGGTFTRASIGTYFDSTGTLQTAASGTPRFDYDPVTHTAKGILIEEARTNLLTYSSMSSLTGWTGSNVSILTVNNPGSLPVGASACLRDEVNTGQSFGYNYKSLTLSLATPYTFSVWVYIPSSVPAGKANLSAWYNNAGWQSISNVTIPERDQWVRKTLTFTTNATYATTIVGAGLSGVTPGLQSYSCLAQLEQGSFATSYIPTTTAAVTREADDLIIPSSTWYTQSSGSVFVQGATNNATSSNNPAFVSLSDGTTNNRLIIRRTNATYHPNLRLVVSGSSLADIQGGSVSSDANSHKFAVGYQSANNKIYFDNVYQIGYLTASAMPSVTQLQLGNGPASNYLNGSLEKLKYYPARAPDTQLQLLTQ